MIDCAEYSKEFPLSDEIIYLNHAAVSPWPRKTTDAIIKFTDENLVYGASNYPEWIKTETSLRKQIQLLINAPSSDDIALLKNTSEALSVVAYGLSWSEGDEIIIPDQEFPSNRIVWESLIDKGVNVITVNITDAEVPENAIIDAITSSTRLISVSSVQYTSGLRLNLEPIGVACKSNNILFCVDAIQSLGVFEMDVQKIHAD
ncbi:MAG: aminotransferase class V-fold PLP-dependent enzyme, partial [Gammaproteobacteria bacterium]